MNMLSIMETTFYKKSSLYIPGDEVREKRWYIRYWPWDEKKQEFVCRKLYKLPDAGTEKVRLEKCQALCREIDQALKSGFVIGEEDTPPEEVRIEQLFQEYIEVKKGQCRPRSVEEMSRHVMRFMNFLKAKRYGNIPLYKIDDKVAIAYRDHLIKTGISNRTTNNYINFVKAFIYHSLERYPNRLYDNPFGKLRSLKIVSGRNQAYSKNQISRLLEVHRQYPDLDFLAKFMYYTLLRTNEIASLQVKHFNQYRMGYIYLSGTSSKTGIDRHVMIPEPLMELMEDRSVLDNPADFYIFSLKPERIANKRRVFVPGPVRADTRRLGERYRTIVLDKLNFSKDYTLYSWKHTGVVNAYNAGIPPADIMQQTGLKGKYYGQPPLKLASWQVLLACQIHFHCSLVCRPLRSPYSLGHSPSQNKLL